FRRQNRMFLPHIPFSRGDAQKPAFFLGSYAIALGCTYKMSDGFQSTCITEDMFLHIQQNPSLSLVSVTHIPKTNDKVDTNILVSIIICFVAIIRIHHST
ncbi:MAG: hypothetical protein PVG32_13915, partial [Anaerolineales bacterium]